MNMVFMILMMSLMISIDYPLIYCHSLIHFFVHFFLFLSWNFVELSMQRFQDLILLIVSIGLNLFLKDLIHVNPAFILLSKTANH